jgi:hypothetical protein
MNFNIRHRRSFEFAIICSRGTEAQDHGGSGKRFSAIGSSTSSEYHRRCNNIINSKYVIRISRVTARDREAESR